MATRLPSTLKQIHWSLALRAAALGLVWLFLPWWIFLLGALYFYFVPLFHSRQLIAPFAAFLFLSFYEPVGVGFAVVLAILFYAILGVKDLILVDRQTAYDSLVLGLVFLLDLWFFSTLGTNILPIFSFLLLSAATSILFREALLHHHPEWFAGIRSRHTYLALGIIWFLLSQFSLAAFFLPLSYLLQTALVFFSAVIFFAFLSLSLHQASDRRRVLLYFSATFVFWVFLFGSIRWGL